MTERSEIFEALGVLNDLLPPDFNDILVHGAGDDGEFTIRGSDLDAWAYSIGIVLDHFEYDPDVPWWEQV